MQYRGYEINKTGTTVSKTVSMTGRDSPLLKITDHRGHAFRNQFGNLPLICSVSAAMRFIDCEMDGPTRDEMQRAADVENSYDRP